MNNSRKVLRRTGKSGEGVKAQAKPAGDVSCSGIDAGAGSTLHSRIKGISPQLLKILKKQ